MTGVARARAGRGTRGAATALAATVALAALAGCGESDAVERYGRDLVFGTSIPDAAIDRFNAFEPKPRDPAASPPDNPAADTEDWESSTPIYASAAGNPYRVAIRLTGEVTAPDGAVTLWLGGFGRTTKSGDPDGTVVTPIAGLDAPAPSAAGTTRFEKAMASSPVSFREDAKLFPLVQLQRKAGLKIESVDVEVWSGIAEPTWKEILFGWQGALVGLMMLVLGWFRFRPRD